VAHFLHAFPRRGIFDKGQPMNRTDVSSQLDASTPRPRDEIPTEYYDGVELAPHTLESLVTWDVCGHARREQDRLTAAYRAPKGTQGGY
jgi:hypothetical protein